MCKKIFGFCPLLTRASVLKDGQTIPVLKYGVERLYKTGLQQITDKTKEIDRLLQFCDEQFMLHVYE